MKRLRMFKISVAVMLVLALFAAFPGVSAQAADAGSTAGVVSTSWGSLYVRSLPSTGGTILTKLAKGTYVTLLEKSGSWWRVECGSGQYGYVSAGYIGTVSGAYTADVTAYYLNVRAGAGTAYSIKNVLENGDTVIVLSSSGSWCKILYNGTQTGYVSAKYLSSASTSSAMTWPVPASTTINQYFIAGTHLGIDIDSAVQGVSGDSVVAACAGTVVWSGWLSGYGNVIYINSYYNGQYIQTRYAHLSSRWVSAGDTVYAGQQIGQMGSTGTSSGVHLHFEVRLRASSAECLANSASTAVDPLQYLY